MTNSCAVLGGPPSLTDATSPASVLGASRFSRDVPAKFAAFVMDSHLSQAWASAGDRRGLSN